MSYLNDYLKVIPKADADIIRENIAENTEIFEIKQLTEENYEALIDDLINSEDVLTNIIELNDTITADDLNDFYSNVALDLHKLFPEQNNIERLGENYDRIYQGHLDELSHEIEKLRDSINRLNNKEMLQENVLTKSYSFEPDRKEEFAEIYTENTAYLFTDRDGRELSPANQEKLFHTYHLTLNKDNEVNILLNDKGISTAKLEVVYESPYVLENTNPEYSIEKAIDGDEGTFWFNVAQKPDNSLDYVSIYPQRTKEERKHVSDKSE